MLVTVCEPSLLGFILSIVEDSLVYHHVTIIYLVFKITSSDNIRDSSFDIFSIDNLKVQHL